jgi:hypothetical protein
LICRADRRAELREGIKIEISSAMIPITTNNSTSVKPAERRLRV